MEPGVNGRLNSKCDCVGPAECWHDNCVVVRVFQNGRVLLLNNRGHVRAADVGEVTLTTVVQKGWWDRYAEAHANEIGRLVFN